MSGVESVTIKPSDTILNPTPSDALRAIPTLDGLRGIAILLVITYHFFPFAPATNDFFYRYFYLATTSGWVGVDLFFVLSGFLITRVLLQVKTQAHRFRNFYARRALRIFPVYYGYLVMYAVVVFVLGWTLMSDAAVGKALGELPWLIPYATNILIAQSGAFISSPLNHFWTLAVEEQFYLFWPFLVFYLRPRNLAWACIVCIVSAIVFRCLALDYNISPYAIHVLTPFRMDSFAVGALVFLACDEMPFRRFLARAAPILFVLLATGIIGFAVWRGQFNAGDTYVQAFGYTWLAVLCGCLIAMVFLAKPASFLYRLFSLPALRRFGKYSYALYVIHYPVYLILTSLWPLSELSTQVNSLWLCNLIQAIFGVALSVVAGRLCWDLIERRCMKYKDLFV